MGLGRAACSLAELALAFNWQMPGASKPANSDLDEYAGINGLQKYHSIYTAASSSKRTLVTQAVWLQCDLVTTDGSDVEAEAEAYVCRLTAVHAFYERQHVVAAFGHVCWDVKVYKRQCLYNIDGDVAVSKGPRPDAARAYPPASSLRKFIVGAALRVRMISYYIIIWLMHPACTAARSKPCMRSKASVETEMRRESCKTAETADNQDVSPCQLEQSEIRHVRQGALLQQVHLYYL